jgi:hypothetical protein
MEIFTWLETTAVANTIRTVPWIYPTLETAHYIGLALLVGGILLTDLRLLGFAARLPLKSMLGLLRFVWAGFAINVVSGSLIFIYGAAQFSANSAFRVKMVLMLLAGINAFIFTRAAAGEGERWIASGHVPPAIKAVATASVILWLGVVTAGRWMAYV